MTRGRGRPTHLVALAAVVRVAIEAPHALLRARVVSSVAAPGPPLSSSATAQRTSSAPRERPSTGRQTWCGPRASLDMLAAVRELECGDELGERERGEEVAPAPAQSRPPRAKSSIAPRTRAFSTSAISELSRASAMRERYHCSASSSPRLGPTRALSSLPRARLALAARDARRQARHLLAALARVERVRRTVVAAEVVLGLDSVDADLRARMERRVSRERRRQGERGTYDPVLRREGLLCEREQGRGQKAFSRQARGDSAGCTPSPTTRSGLTYRACRAGSASAGSAAAARGPWPGRRRTAR